MPSRLKQTSNQVLFCRILFPILFILFLSTLASLFIFKNSLFEGHDLGYFLYRLEGISDGLADGEFPVRIHTSQIQGYGYPTGIMFGDWFYYPAAYLHSRGLSIVHSYNLIIFCLNLLTVSVSFYSFKKAFNSNWCAVVGAVLWTFSYYRIENITLRADVGEALAMSFYPALFLALFRVLNRDRSIDGCQISSVFAPWQLAGVAMAGIVISNLPATVLMIILVLVSLVIYIPIFKADPGTVVLQGLKALALTFLLGAFYIVPFLDYYLTESLAYSVGGGVPGTPLAMEFHSVRIRQLFSFFQPMTGCSMGYQAVDGWMPTTTGIAMLVCPIASTVLLFMPKFKSIRKLILPLIVIAVFLMIACTHYFPWNCNVFLVNKILSFVSKIQFPWRLLGPASFYLCLASIVLFAKIQYLYMPSRQLLSLLIGVSICFLAFAEGMYGINTFIKSQPVTTFEIIKSVDAGIYDAQFVPANTDVGLMLQGASDYPSSSESIELIDFNKNGTKCIANVSVLNGGTIDLPLLNYKYYDVSCSNKNLSVSIGSNSNNLIRLNCKGTGSAVLVIDFIEPVIWRIAEIVSFVSIVILTGYLLYRRFCCEEKDSIL